jgi:hypothetical protein
MTSKILDTSSLTATIIPKEGEPLTLVYDISTATNIIVEDTLASSGVAWEPLYREEITEYIERGRGFLDRGVKIGITLPEALGGVGFEFETKDRKEIKTTSRVIYRQRIENKK